VYQFIRLREHGCKVRKGNILTIKNKRDYEHSTKQSTRKPNL
jgi:hypothetical protein